jgi:4,5-epoxidase
MTVTVVGAGPTGLVLACGLLGAGVPVRVVDRADGPAVTSRALGLQPRGTEVLDRLGALGDLPGRSVGIDRISMHVNGEHLADMGVGQRTKLVTRRTLSISQAEIEGALRTRFAELGGTIEWGTEVIRAEQDDHGVALTTADGRTTRTDWLVGCDGAHSAVRKAMGVGFPGVPLVERFRLADVRAKLPLPRSAAAVWLRGEDFLGAFPLPGDDSWRIMSSTDEGDLVDLLAQQARISTVFEETRWTSTFSFHRRLADTYRIDRVLLAGDAAHIHSPFGGQGMNTGMGDAENLAWKLVLVSDGRAEPSLLDTYEAERRPIAADVLASTSGTTQVITGDRPLFRFLRDRVVVPLMNLPLVQRLIRDHASQLKISYRKGPLGGRGLGGRVPDRTIGETRLHAELGTRWVLLGPDELGAVARKRLGDGHVTVLPTDGDAMLVRPDGHLAWRGAPVPDALDARLTGILGV